jgi:hypothetical protein
MSNDPANKETSEPSSHFLIKCSCESVIELCGCVWLPELLIVVIP